MAKISGSYYYCDSESDKVIKLPDNTDFLRKNHIYSYNSDEAMSWNKKFRDKIDQGETLYLLGFQGIIHNSGVSLVEASKKTGIKILANYEEERFTGKKHFAGYPENSVYELKKYLTKIGKTTDDIFSIFYGWDLLKLEQNFQKLKVKMFEQKLRHNAFDDYLLHSVISEEAHKEVYNPMRKEFYVYSPLLVRIVERLIKDLGLQSIIPCIQMPHHENHAYLSYGISPFSAINYCDKTTIVSCIDGNGDISSASFYGAKGAELTLIKRMDFEDSLGNFYGLLACFLGGWSALSAEGRYMGAAAWGNYNRLTNSYYMRLKQYFYYLDNGNVVANRAMVENNYSELQDIVGPFLQIKDLWNPDFVLSVNDIKHSKITQKRVDIAAAVQMVFEDALFHIIAYLIHETGSDQLVLCGGTALNCVANMRLIEHFNKDYYQMNFCKDTQLHIWVPPIPSDQGVVVGAPYQFAMKNGVKTLGELPSPFLCGLSPSSINIRETLETSSFIHYDDLGNINDENTLKKVADYMAYIVSQDGIVGIYQGSAETGPRALGHRSFLSNPCNPDTLKIVNSRVKLRERIRPLAPMVTLKDAKRWFKLSEGASVNNYDAYNYMILTVEAKEEAKEVIPAVIHYDGTSRIQIVRKKNNLLMFEYLKALKKYVGVEVSVNTSLNVGSAIVQNPNQVLQVFKRAKGLDGIFMIGDEGDVFLVWAKEGIQEIDSNIADLKATYITMKKSENHQWVELPQNSISSR
ncbi:MAG: carbamoyltransferase [Candidatus Brocadiaceae bacterium]|nr:carbamoyltransferase [Candidatus Brocadiaceae bacterium]